MNLAYLHISELTATLARFKPDACGIYLLLILDYLKTEKPPVDDRAELEFLAHVETPKQRVSLDFVLKRCFTLSDNGTGPKVWRSELCDQMILDYRKNCIQARWAILCRHWEKVNKGAPKPTFESFAEDPSRYYDETTKRLRVVTGRKPLVLESYSHDTTSVAPSEYAPVTSNQEPVTSNREITPVVPKGTDTIGLPDLEKLADAIYALYPRKEAKKAAIRAIVKVLKSGEITELELQASVRAYSAAVAKWPHESRYTREGTDTVPHPATWFNRGSYTDDPMNWIREPKPVSAQKKEEGGAQLFEAFGEEMISPEGWQEAWAQLFTAPCPDAWLDVPAVNRAALNRELKKRKGGR